MNQQKPFLTINEQINLLEQRNLTINSKLKLKTYLTRYSYSQIINGYNNPFFKNFNRTSNSYRNDANSDGIIDLFNYDRRISIFVISTINNIERILGTAIGHVIGLKMSSLNKQDGKILDPNFDISKIFKISNDKEEILKNLKDIHFSSTSLSDKYKKNNKWVYEEIPIWILCTTWHFGTLLEIYKNLNSELKNNILKHFKTLNCNPDQFYKLVNAFRKIRNIISHNNVLFDIRLKLRIDNFSKFIKNNNLNIDLNTHGLRIYDFVLLIDTFLGMNGKQNSLKNIFCRTTDLMITNNKNISEDSKKYILNIMSYK